MNEIATVLKRLWSAFGLLIPLGIGAVFSVVGGLISTWIIRNLLFGGDNSEPG